MTSCGTCALYPLPLLPSDLIRFALKDFEACERDQDYVTDPTQRIGFDIWEGKIGVGLDGALLVKSLGVTVTRSKVFWDAPDLVSAQIYAVGRFAAGEIHAPLSDLLGIHLKQELPETLNLPDYEADPTGYKESIRDMAKLLASQGL